MDTTASEYTNSPLEIFLQNPSTPTVEGASLFENHDKEIFSQLAAILDDGYVFKSSNLDLGEIELRKGKKSTGLTHIIVRKQEATESISTVIAQYEYTPEFLDMYAQVGAVLTSYGFSLEHNTTSVNTSLVQGTTNNAHQAGKGVYMSNEFAALEDQYLEQMANGGASDRALEEGYLEQESQKDTRNLYSQGDVVKEGQKKPYYQQQAENLLTTLHQSTAG